MNSIPRTRSLLSTRRLAVLVVLPLAAFLGAGAEDTDSALTDEKSPRADCAADEAPWQRAPGTFLCAKLCQSDESCLGYVTGDERCRLLVPFEDTVDVFVDAATAEVLDAEDASAVAEVEELIASDAGEDALAAACDGDCTEGSMEPGAMMVVTPACDEACTDMEVPVPVAARTLRVCDPLWDVDVAAMSEPSDDEAFDHAD